MLFSLGRQDDVLCREPGKPRRYAKGEARRAGEGVPRDRREEQGVTK